MGVSEIGGGARSLGQTGEVLSRKSRLQVRFPCLPVLRQPATKVAVWSESGEHSDDWVP